MKSSDDDFSVFQSERDYEKSILGEKPKREFGKRFKQRHYEHKILKSGGSKRNSIKDRDLSRNKNESFQGRFLVWYKGLTVQASWAFRWTVYGTIIMFAAMVLLYRVDSVLTALAFTAGIVFYFVLYLCCSDYTTYYKLYHNMGVDLKPFKGFHSVMTYKAPIVFDGKRTVRILEEGACITEVSIKDILQIKEGVFGTDYHFYMKDGSVSKLLIQIALEDDVKEVLQKILAANKDIEYIKKEITLNPNGLKEKLKSFKG